MFQSCSASLRVEKALLRLQLEGLASCGRRVAGHRGSSGDITAQKSIHVGGGDRPCPGEDQHPLDGVAELADVAGPLRCSQPLRSQQSSNPCPPIACARPASCSDEVLPPAPGCPRAAPAAAAPRWGRRSGDRTDPPGIAPRRSPPRLLVGGGDDAHIDLDRLGPSDASHHTLLQHPQHLGLGRKATCRRPRPGRGCRRRPARTSPADRQTPP